MFILDTTVPQIFAPILAGMTGEDFHQGDRPHPGQGRNLWVQCFVPSHC
ncbi:hypothetical protein VB712_07480 [Spirulina sp. CCNP1310]|nr:hypothetical protein [Spirulina sp. CCNP1310]MEA5419066.1 hypothetical protein [Spirulina sp. CCNP1310]